MRHLLIGVSAAATIAVVGPAWAQGSPQSQPSPAGAYPTALWAQTPAAPQPWPPAAYPAPVPPPQPWPAAAYPVVRYPFPAVSPEAAYNDGLINRWELEQYEGPTPQALQGPNPSGNKGSQGDRGM